MGLTHHDGISVYGSGLALGKKYAEVYVGCSGVDGMCRMDVSWVITSTGGVANGVSTRLSSIIFATGQMVGTVKCSGQDQVYLNWSGGAFDLTVGNGIGGACTSSFVSVLSSEAWPAIHNRCNFNALDLFTLQCGDILSLLVGRFFAIRFAFSQSGSRRTACTSNP